MKELKIDNIETIYEFEEFLKKVSEDNPVFFPIYYKYSELLKRHITFIRFMVILALIAGFSLGWWCRTWLI